MSVVERVEGVGEERDGGSAGGAGWLRAESVYVVALVGAGFALRVWGLSKMHFWDENVSADAETICCGKTNYSELDSRPPLLSLIFAGVFLVWNSTYAAAIVTALLNAARAAWTYLSGRMIAGRGGGGDGVAAVWVCAVLCGGAAGGAGVCDQPGRGHTAGGCAGAEPDRAGVGCCCGRWSGRRMRFAAAGFALAMCVLMRFGSLSSVGVLGSA